MFSFYMTPSFSVQFPEIHSSSFPSVSVTLQLDITWLFYMYFIEVSAVWSQSPSKSNWVFLAVLGWQSTMRSQWEHHWGYTGADLSISCQCTVVCNNVVTLSLQLSVSEQDIEKETEIWEHIFLLFLPCKTLSGPNLASCMVALWQSLNNGETEKCREK